jgi:hypothetical protein
LLAQDRLFSPGTPASSTNKTGRHDIAEILLKVAVMYMYVRGINFASVSTMFRMDYSTVMMMM